MKAGSFSKSRSPSNFALEGEGNRDSSKKSGSRGTIGRRQRDSSPSRGATRIEAISVEAQAEARANAAQQEADLLASALLRV